MEKNVEKKLEILTIYITHTHKMTEIEPFEDLNTSTITMMVYSNLSFDLM